ncbi:MAG: hypothetical protein QOF76_5614, partial [Solirubrobacteraceae bacterium]|nr:hypothetical protein [Solirubrobacteraceae bacterium]
MPETAEFDDLITQLRDERPEIDPGFARELDTRAAAGFAKPRRRWLPRLSLLTAPGAPAVALGMVVALVVVVAVAGSDPSRDGAGGSGAASSGGSTSAFSPPPEIAQAQKAVGETTEPLLRSQSGASADAVAPSAARAGVLRGRVQEQSAAITLVAPAKDVADVGDRIIGVADQVGGFVVSSNVRATDGEGGGGDFVLRVPVTRLDDALARLSRLGHVAERTQGSQDITAERNFAREHLEEALAERKSLLLQLAKATTTAEVESLKARLHDVSNAIQGYRTDLAKVVRRARFAQVSVTLTAKPKHAVVGPEDDGKWTPADAIRDAGRFLEVAAGVVLLVGSVLLPLA